MHACKAFKLAKHSSLQSLQAGKANFYSYRVLSEFGNLENVLFTGFHHVKNPFLKTASPVAKKGP
jgi:hypothetical protein